MQSVQQIIDQGALDHPEKIFLTIAETGDTLTWSQLQMHSCQINSLLDQKQIERGATVSFLLDNGYWTTLLLLGVMYSGRVVLALNAVSGQDAMRYIIGHSDASLLFINDRYRKQYAKVLDNSHDIEVLSTCEITGLECELSNNPQTPNRTIESDDTALLIYTSGTTGMPKGVLLTHKNVIAGGQYTALAHDIKQNDIAMCVLPLYHINAQMVTVMAPLVSGSQVVMRAKFSASHFWHDMLHYNCTWFSVVPTIISYLIDNNADGITTEQMAHIKERVRFGRSASAALSPAKHQLFETRFGISIVETMGLSETAAQILSNPITPGDNKYGSPGIAVGNEAKVIDKKGQTAAVGEIGELMIRGDNVMQGYYKNPEVTAETINAEGWLHTGDLSYCDEDGFFFITGRIKELIIKGGENVAPREIDDVLYRHPAVLEAAAFGVDDEHYGQEIMACVALCPGMEVTEEELLALCIESLGKYKTPKNVFIRDELPKGPSGKIQRLKLSA
ncbi:MAG: long-chain acyl-CoA synthetase [Saprospiraceae bacterium]|jgi:long-chain acyl-CoA synthetase